MISAWWLLLIVPGSAVITAAALMLVSATRRSRFVPVDQYNGLQMKYEMLMKEAENSADLTRCRDCMYWGTEKHGGEIAKAIENDKPLKCVRQEIAGFMIGNCWPFMMNANDGCTRGHSREYMND